MRAVELPAHGAPLRLVRRPVPEPGPGEVRVRVQACGVCGSDVFLQNGGFASSPLPIVPGHEAAGVVDALGDGVDDVPVGTVVALYYLSTPAGDPWAAAGFPNRSPAVVRMGVDIDGAFAEYVLRPRASLIVPAAPLPGARARRHHRRGRDPAARAAAHREGRGRGDRRDHRHRGDRLHGRPARARLRRDRDRDQPLAGEARPRAAARGRARPALRRRHRRRPARADRRARCRRRAAVRRLGRGLRAVAVARRSRRAHRARSARPRSRSASSRCR